MENVHYIAYYGKLDNHRNLYIYPAAVAKASYVISALKQVGYKVTVLSTAGTKNRYSCRYRRYEKEIDDQETIIYVDSFGSKHKLLRGFLKIWILLQLFYYLMVFVKPNDKVIVYHSTSYKWPLLAARALKKFYLIFEVEEIYAASFGKSKKRQNKEIE